MRTLEGSVPRRGLSVPLLTVIGPGGSVIEEEQRALVRFVIQDGLGADIVFVMGTSGEWNRLPRAERERAVVVAVDETRRVSEGLVRAGREAVEVWVGVTAPTTSETIAAFALALECRADAAVLAPLSIRDCPDPVRLLQREVVDLFEERGRQLPVYLYDNADVAADPHRPHLRTRDVKRASRLDFVRGIKVSAGKRVLGHYTKAALHFKDKGAFGIYVGNAMLIFDLFRLRDGLWGRLVEHWNRYWLHNDLPVGVVAGPANVLPREWQKAWQVATAADEEAMANLASLLGRLRAMTPQAGGRRKTIAALKRALRRRGVIGSDAVAPGTPALDEAEGARFDAAFDELRALVAERLPARWVSR